MSNFAVSKQKRKKMQEFITPPKHVNFRAKKLFGEMGHIPHSCWNNIDSLTKMIGITVL